MAGGDQLEMMTAVSDSSPPRYSSKTGIERVVSLKGKERAARQMIFF